jgi:transcriptional regulator with XRE-family HTH domain
MLTFGERLKAARKRRGLTLNDVQERTGVGFRSLSRYENETASPDPDVILELIRLYDVSADYIMGLSSEMGHAAIDGEDNTSATPRVAADLAEICETLDGLPDDLQDKAKDYIEMLKTLDEVKSGKNFLDLKKKA